MPWLRFYSCDSLALQVQNQWNPKCEGPFGFQIVPNNINGEVVLAKAILDFKLGAMINAHAILHGQP